LKKELNDFSNDALEQASIQIKYDVYIEKEKGLLKE
jgi:tRNA uridine 5-carboxymethylaminomethyl modification enzyme